MLSEVTGELKCVLQYNLALFKHETMQAFVKHFQHLIEQAVQTPDQLFKDFAVLSQEEEQAAKRKEIVQRKRTTCAHNQLDIYSRSSCSLHSVLDQAV